MTSLGHTGFRIGPCISPGVPWVNALHAPISLALKVRQFLAMNRFSSALKGFQALAILAKKSTLCEEEMVFRDSASFSSAAMPPSAGNLSLLLPDGNILATPTGSCLGNLITRRLSKWLRRANSSAAINRPKDCVFHLALYRNPLMLQGSWYICTALVNGAFTVSKGWTRKMIRPFYPSR